MNLFKNLFLSEGLPDVSNVGDSNFLERIIPNLTSFLLQFFAFIVMCIVVWKLAYKPVKAFIKKRQEYLANNLEEAASKNEEASKNLEESKASINAARREATEIIQNAKNEANATKAAMLDEAKLDIQQRHARAVEDLKKEQEKAIKQVHDDVVDLAIETSKSILERKIEVSDDKKLIDDLVDELMEKK